MPGVLDFLFEGSPPASTETWGQTVDNIPKWLSDYTQGLIGRANIIAAEPYQTYEGPRISGFHPDQMAAFDITRQGAGSWIPALQGAGEQFYQAGQANPLAAAAPFLNSAGSQWGDEGTVDQYMNPYMEHVFDRQAEMTQRNLDENLLPSMQSAFIGSGAFGSDRMTDIAGQVGRDTAEGLQGQQMAALSGAYDNAGRMYQGDMARHLQTGLGAGTLAGQGAELNLAAGQQMGALGESLQRLQYGDAAALEAVGAQQRGLEQGSLDLAYNDFLRQNNYPREMVDWMSQIIRGLPGQGGVSTTTDYGPSSVYSPSPLSQMASMYSAYRGFNPQTSAGTT